MRLRMNPVIGSFVLIASVTLFQCTDAAGHSAGEDTPVWIARCGQNQVVTYERLEKGAVKRAIAYLQSDKFQSLRPKREIRSLQDHEEFDELHNFEHLARRDAEFLANNRSRSERSYGSMRGVNVLAVAQYDASEVTDDASREKFINEKILYVIAYWRLFNIKVGGNTRTKNWSKVHVHLVGIIIALDRGSTPYLDTSAYAETVLWSAGNYWKSPPPDFPSKAYHAVAIITDLRPWDSHVGFFECGSKGGANTIIVWDSLNFRAVRKHTTIAPFQKVANSLHSWSRRAAEVPDYMESGRQIEILPGKLYSPEQQCYFGGYTSLGRLCPEYSENCEIWCRNSGWFRSCGSIGKAWEGTPCVNGKVG